MSGISVTLFSLSLKLSTSLFLSCPQHLRLQQEWFLDFCMNRLDSGVVGWNVEDGTISAMPTMEDAYSQPSIQQSRQQAPLSGEFRELILESICQLVCVPGSLVDMYVHFDCNMTCMSHPFEVLVRFLAKHVFPDATPGGPVTMPMHQLLCLDTLLLYLKNVYDRRNEISVEKGKSEQLLENKKRKRILLQGAEEFNKKPKVGISFLQQHGFLPPSEGDAPVDPKSLAAVLKNTPMINKTKLGDYLSRKEHLEILKAFIGDFSFTGVFDWRFPHNNNDI